MQFKTKDLLITVFPNVDPAKCLLNTKYCLDPTVCTPPSVYGPIPQCAPCTGFANSIPCFYGTCGPCSIIHSACGPCSAAHPHTFVPTPPQLALGDPLVIRDPGDLVTLRTQLQDAIKVLDEHEKAGTLNPIKTKADAERVEAGITEALNQVREMKAKVK